MVAFSIFARYQSRLEGIALARGGGRVAVRNVHEMLSQRFKRHEDNLQILHDELCVLEFDIQSTDRSDLKHRARRAVFKVKRTLDEFFGDVGSDTPLHADMVLLIRAVLSFGACFEKFLDNVKDGTNVSAMDSQNKPSSQLEEYMNQFQLVAGRVLGHVSAETPR